MQSASHDKPSQARTNNRTMSVAPPSSRELQSSSESLVFNSPGCDGATLTRIQIECIFQGQGRPAEAFTEIGVLLFKAVLIYEEQ